MCGIVGYIGFKEAFPILLKGLKRLEYRGYDSSGVVLLEEDTLQLFKKKGKVKELEQFVEGKQLAGNIGIGHTRWATHGVPNDLNAHPHLSFDGNMAMIHNGIIENYAYLKQILVDNGFEFKSETDTEVLLNYIQFLKNKDLLSVEKALQQALQQVKGTYCILLLSVDEPNVLFAARKGSPLVIGIGENEFFLASDATPLLGYTHQVFYPKNEEIILLKRHDFQVIDFNGEQVTPVIQELLMEEKAIEKGGFDHYMLKEMYEQPESFTNCLRGRIQLDTGTLIKTEDIRTWVSLFQKAPRIIIVSCGSSWHAGLLGEYWIEELARIPVEVEYASEFRYRNPIIYPGDIVLAISQSGETADTLVALEKAKDQGALIFSIVNVVGSSIPRISDACAYTHSGPEIGVASTKTFLGQLGVLMLLAMGIAEEKNSISSERIMTLGKEMVRLPRLIEKVLKQHDHIKSVVKSYTAATDVLFLGRGYNFPIALEGALKLKEISYIHAEGYPAAEMKHGPIALVDEHLPVVFLATKDNCYEKIISNIQEIKARGGKIIALATEGDEIVPALAKDTFFLPETDELLAPFLNVIVLQLFSYEMGIQKGLDVDQPRNLAKSVTVE
jgi:glucosamine--fructose-6-phosphate aminotransferase (isomerizing)